MAYCCHWPHQTSPIPEAMACMERNQTKRPGWPPESANWRAMLSNCMGEQPSCFKLETIWVYQGYQAHRTDPELRRFNWNEREMSFRTQKQDRNKIQRKRKRRKICCSALSTQESHPIPLRTVTRCCLPHYGETESIAGTTPPAVYR